MAHHESPWDPGLQNERTELAWQRTALAVLTATVVMARLLWGAWPVVAAATCAIAVVITVVLGTAAASRYRSAHRRLHARDPLGGGALPAALTALLVLLGATAALWVISG